MASLSSSSSSSKPLYEGYWSDIASGKSSDTKCQCGQVVLRFTFPFVRQTQDYVTINQYVDRCEKGHAYLGTTSCRDNLRLVKNLHTKLADTDPLLAQLPPFRRAPPPPPFRLVPELKRPPMATSVLTIPSEEEGKKENKEKDEKEKEKILAGSELQTYLLAVCPSELSENDIGHSNVIAVGSSSSSSSTYYILGGRYEASDRVMSYNTVLKTWETRSPMPRKFKGHALARTHAGEIIVTGGLSSRFLLNCHKDVYIYTPSTNTWRTLPDMPYVMAYHSALVYRDSTKNNDECLVVLGGVENPENYLMYKSGAIFHFATLTWSPFPVDMIKYRMDNVRVEYCTNGNLRVTGGQYAETARGDATTGTPHQGEEYNFETRTWSLIVS